MGPLKLPGPDGFGAGFYQKHWATVGTNITNAALSLLNGKGMIPSLNSTFIVLIPIKQSTDSICDFRPISLCNIFYKIISKTITNRLKTLMNELITSNQSVFIPGRLIFDNIMIAHELLHSLNKLRKSKNGRMAVKLDMSKAYDRVE